MEKTPRLPFILITALFLAWGIANNMTDTLLAAFKRIMSMTDYQTTFVQYAFYGAYFCFAMPAALFIKKFTYKSGVLLGLGMFILGALLFYPDRDSTPESGPILQSSRLHHRCLVEQALHSVPVEPRRCR
jgi:FHS family L-fucose permease-like MFS transporter